MKKMRNRLLSSILVLAMVISWLPGNFLQAEAAEETQLYGDSTNWPEWSGEAFPETGEYHYKLAGDVDLAGVVSIPADATVAIDLCGNKIRAQEGSRSFSVEGTLIIQDSSEAQTGQVEGSDSGNIYLNVGAELDLHSGTITGGTAKYGGNIYMEGGTFNMYGGTVSDGTASRGGNIYLAKGAELDLHSGTITGGTASWGCNLYVTGMSTAIYISGGTVSGGVLTGTTDHGGICSQYSNLHISGGTVRDDIYLTRQDNNYSKLYVSGGTISGAITAAGVNYSGDSHVIEISGGKLTGTTLIKTAKTMILSGAPLINNLTLESGVLVTQVELSAGADITVDATGVFTTALENAEQQAQYFKTTEQSNFVEAVEGVLQIIVGCPCGCKTALEEIDWQDWSGDDITESGHYRLLGSFRLSSPVTIDAGLDVVLDLYGNQLTAPNSARSFEVSGRLSILDSSEAQTGQVEGSTIDANGGNIYLKKGAVLDLYSGTITGGKVTGEKNDYGGNIYMEGGTFNMYGGAVTGGTAKRGGNIYLSKGTVRITGGEITGGTASWGGGNLFVTGMSNAIYISGGTVSGGSTKNGGICSRFGNLHISGGTVEDDIYVAKDDGTNAALYISGGIISGNITTAGVSYSGDSHVIEISGGKLTGTTLIKTAKTMILSGAPVINNLTLESGVLVTPVELSADADITIDATGVFTTALENAESYIASFQHSDDKECIVQNGALALVEIVASGNCGSNLTWELTDTGVLIISGTGAMTDFYRLNDLVNDVPWDNNRAKVTSIVIEPGVTSIGDYAFYDCYNLKSITIANTVTDVGNYAFYGCTDLTEVVLPDALTNLGNNAFYGCTALTEVVLPDDLTSLGNYAFYGCTALTEVVLPDDLTSLGNHAFYGCTSLESIVIPDGITSIGSNTFRNCTGLEEVTLPASVTSIGANAFNGCSALTNVYYRGTEVQWKAIDVGSNNTILTDLAAAGHVHYFYVTGGGMTGSEVHWKLTEDTTLTIFGTGAMSNYYYDSANTLFVGTPWQEHADQITAVKIESGVTSVGNWAFYGLTNLTSVTLAGDVTRIGDHAFRGCTALTEINLDSVEVIGRNAFQGCTGLTDFNCTSAETLGAYAFYGCTGLTVFTVPETMTAIGEHAFDGCAALQTVTLVSGTTSIGSNAFANCGNLTAINVSEDNASFASGKDGALYNKAMTTLVQVPGGITGRFTVPEGVTAIGAGAFAGCDELTEVILPATVKELAAAAFDGCGSLTAINVSKNNKNFASGEDGALYNKDMTTLMQVPGGTAGIYSVAEKVTTVGQSAFAGNKGITEVTLPSSVTTVEKWAFSCSENLAKITLPSDVPSILVGAFEHTGLTDVYYQGSNLQWEDETVEGYNEPLLNATVRCLLVAEGTSNDIAWVLTDEGVLTFTGNGALADYTAENMPWYSYREMITQVVFGEGITYVGSNILNGCTVLTEVTIPVSVTVIGDDAFAGCIALTDVYYSGSLARWNNLPVGKGNEQLGDAEIHCDFVVPESIKVKTPATKTEYYLNEELDTNGLTLTVLYGDGFTQQIIEGYEVSYDFTRPGTQTVTVTYQQVETTYAVTVIPGGSCGEGLNWLFEETTGILKVTGSGAMPDYNAETPAPWSIFAEQITALELGKDIIAIGANAFGSCTGLQTVTYDGTAKQWAYVTIADGNEPLAAATLICAVLLGDADGDGEVSVLDATAILKNLAGWNVAISVDAADADGDGEVSVLDATAILKFLAGWNVTLG